MQAKADWRQSDVLFIVIYSVLLGARAKHRARDAPFVKSRRVWT